MLQFDPQLAKFRVSGWHRCDLNASAGERRVEALLANGALRVCKGAAALLQVRCKREANLANHVGLSLARHEPFNKTLQMLEIVH